MKVIRIFFGIQIRLCQMRSRQRIHKNSQYLIDHYCGDDKIDLCLYVRLDKGRSMQINMPQCFRLQENGNVLYSRRLSVIAECPMDLTLFPFDSQICKLGIESCQLFFLIFPVNTILSQPIFEISDGYTADQVRYKWSKGIKQALKLHKIRLPDFQVKEAYVTSQLESYATGREFFIFLQILQYLRHNASAPLAKVQHLKYTTNFVL